MYPKTMSSQQFKKRLILLGGLCVVLLIALVGNALYQGNKFHIVGTDPKLSDVASASPFLKVNFNRALKAGSLSYSDPSHIIASTNISGKTATFNLQPGLTDNHAYAITIDSISSSDGAQLSHKTLKFTTVHKDVSQLSSAQQNGLLKQQENKPYDPSFIYYQNFNTLSDDYGLTDGQLSNVEKILYDYSNVIKKQFRTMTLDPNSVSSTTPDPNSDNTTSTIDFSVALGGQTYKAHGEYDALYDSIHVTLSDSTGTLVYDSANTTD